MDPATNKWSILRDFGDQISSDLPTHAQTHLITELLQNLFNCKVFVYLYDPPWIVSDSINGDFDKLPMAFQELIRKSWDSQRTVFTTSSRGNLSADQQGHDHSQKDEINAVATSLILDSNYLGLCVLKRETDTSFSEDEIEFFRFLATYISFTLATTDTLALHNSNLYHTEKLRRQIADNLTEVAGLLSPDISLDKVLESILIELANTFTTTLQAIWLLDEEDNESEMDSALRIAAINGESKTTDRNRKDNFTLETIFGFSVGDFIDKFGLEQSIGSLLYESINTTYPIIRTQDMPFEPLGAFLELDPNYSAICAPLRVGDTPLGVMTLIHAQPGIFGENSQMLSSSFASYAALAIENTRLYENAHDQAWVSTVLLQVSEATQSITSLDELLQTIVHLLPSLIGTRSCAILLWDEYIESFIPGSAYGFSSYQSKDFENWFIAESDVPAFNKLRRTRSPIILDNDSTSSLIGETLFSSFDFSTGLFVLFPMISQSEVKGAILVDFREEGENATGEVSLWEEKISIIQGIANQTAIAADNIQLIQAQEEEAYVSIALLQVAQAVVSSYDLDEILATIVRITPILVGIKRSVIFLWDDDQNIYRASQAYGFSREEIADLQPFYQANHFPLLDWIRENNQPFYIPIESPVEPHEWANIDTRNVSIAEKLSNSRGEETQDIEPLSSEFPLLMGFPLAVKDSVLGIMIIEEIDQTSKVPSIRIREKRLEIITGISQQAAIAIQNDILQRDVLERERLEREMQLAREIQSTFLPDKLPVVDGWELDVRWRPARQVGGDFYDLIELPENRLGIIIADVADKGMPAALYMTLVRTLMRAAIQYQQSPREVLLRVNNLLVPDSRQGMFVTLVYAELSLDTGEMVFANAGHNPPLSFKASTGNIFEHNRDAMALGVFPDIEIQESKIVLEKGDLMFFYTDGITEAFSLHDELFGLERLKAIIQKSSYRSARELLEQVEASVFDFSEGMSQSDDVTLVVIYRQPNS